MKLKKLFLVMFLASMACLVCHAERKFNHPGGILSSSDLERIKLHVNAGDDPWASCWKEMQADNLAKSTYSPYATAEIGGSNGQRQRAAQDAYAAMLNAIEWHVTGREAYAKCAVRILSAWATKLESADAELFQYPSRAMILAAEMLRNSDGSFYSGWSATSRNLFLSKVRNILYPACRKFCTYTTSHPSWYTPAALAVIAAGVLLDDEAIYDEGYQLMLDESHWGTMFGGSIDPSGQMREMARDNVHGGLTLGDIAQACLTCWNQGDDLFAAGDNRLLKGMEYWCRYNTGHTDTPFEPTDCSGLDNMKGIKFYYISTHNNGFRLRPDACCFEAVYHHYKEVKGMDDSYFPYLTIAAKLARPDTNNQLLGYGTLFFTINATTSPYFTDVPAKPAGVIAEDRFKGIRLAWEHPKEEDARGFNIYRSTDGSSFSKLISWDYYTNNEYIDNSAEPGKKYYYKVQLVNKAGASEYSDIVSATAQAGTEELPSGWTFTPIGSLRGKALYTSAQDSTFAVSGAGSDIGGSADSEGFLYKKITGDATLTVRLSSTDESFYKVGIQMRSSLDANAQRVGMTLGELGCRLLRMCTRYSNNSNTTWTEITNYGRAPLWLRLKREGRTFTAFLSRDNVTWHQVGSVSVSMPGTYYVGMASCSGSTSKEYEAIFDHVSLEGKVFVPIIKPSAPASLSAIWSDSRQVTLSWSSQPSVTGYIVYRSSDGAAYEPIATIRSTSYVDRLENNGTYYYKVSACNAVGEGRCCSAESVTTHDIELLSGTIIGSAGSYGNNAAHTAKAALDGNLSTYYDAANTSGDWVGYDLGEDTPAMVQYVTFAPRQGYPGRMNGGRFQVSDNAAFSSPLTIATISSNPDEGVMTKLTAPSGKYYRYIRYIGPDKGNCNVAEVRFYGVKKTVPTGIKEIASYDTTKASDNTAYNLIGLAVTQPGKGVYIVNGRKVLIK